MLTKFVVYAALFATNTLAGVVPTSTALDLSNVVPIASSVSSDLEKRDFANIRISMFAGFNCGGDAVFIDNVRYGIQNTGSSLYNSFSVSRGVRNDEQLDFSTRVGSDSCGRFLVLFRQLNQGCYNSGGISCFRLTQN